MKKIEYLAPEVKVIVLKSKSAILVGSGEETPGTGDADEL
jgi:hypothetical protein